MNGRPTALMDRALREMTALLGDGELLRRYADVGDECAFAAVVERHAAMVMGVCRRLLPTPADAEDACQAVFLVLCRKAGSVAWRPSAAGWLYETARKVARNARDAAARRARHERAAVSVRPPRTRDEPWSAALDEELERLPAKYREPLVLCYLEGLTRDEAASRLGVPAATLKSRLERGRRRLAEALSRRGGEFGSALLATAAKNHVMADPLWVKTIMSAVGGSPTRAAAALALEAGMRAWTMKAICTAVAVAAMAGVGLGMGRPETSAAPKAKPPVVKVDRFGDPLPEGAAMRLGTVSFRSAGLAGVGFREGGELVTLGAEPRVQVWSDAGRAKLGGELVSGNDRAGWQRTMSADGRFAAAVMDKDSRVVVWDVSEAEPIEYASRPTSDPIRPTFSPNAERLAVLDSGRTVTANLLIFHLPTLRWHAMELKGGSTASMTFSPDGNILAVPTYEGVALIDVAAKKEIRRVGTVGPRAVHAAFSPDGKTIALLGDSGHRSSGQMVRVCGLRTGRLHHSFEIMPIGVRWVGYSPTGNALWAGSRTELSEWEPASGKCLRRIAGPAEYPLRFSPDGKRLATCNEDAVLLWELARNRAVRAEVIDAGHASAIMGLTVSPDGKVIASNDIAGDIRLWDARTGLTFGRVRSRWVQHTPAVCFLSDSKSFVAVGEDGVTPVVFETATGRELRRLDVSEKAKKSGYSGGFRLSDDGKTLTSIVFPNVSTGGAFAERWNVASGKSLGRNELHAGWKLIVPPARSPDGRWEISGGHVFRVGSENPVAVIAGGGTAMLSAVFTPDSRLAVIACETRDTGKRFTGGTVIFDLRAGKVLAELPTGEVYRHAVSADGRKVAVMDKHKTAVWDIPTRKQVWSGSGDQGNLIRAHAIAFTPDGKRLVTGHGCSALVWDLP